MKKLLLISVLACGGCTTPIQYTGIDYPTQSPVYTPYQPPLINYNTSHLQQALQDSMRESENMREFLYTTSNRQELINRIETFQRANRSLNELLQNPWNGFYLLNP